MAASFTYDPTLCMDGGVNQMRFELGDTIVEEVGLPAMLSDEEYTAIIAAHEGKWKRAKLVCLEAIMMKLSYEVDTEVDGLSYSLNQRAERWRDMYEKLKKELNGAASISGARLPKGMEKKDYYFHTDMHTNPRKW